MSERSYLIVGGVGGIGEAIARRLAGAGHRVSVTSRSADRALTLAREIGATAAMVDVRDESSVVAAVEAASAGGMLHGLAYCVGTIPFKPLARVTTEEMRDAYELNVVGAMVAIRAAAPALRAASGSVLLFSSVAARQGFANHAVIGAAKAGVEGLAVSLAAELAPKVRVNAIAPSLTVTPLSAPMLANEKVAEGIAALHPIPRLGSADEIAALGCLLLSDDAAWITGQVIGVDGGRSTLRVGRA